MTLTFGLLANLFTAVFVSRVIFDANLSRKLHGEPRLMLRARHEDLGRRLSAVIWAALCLALCVAAVQTLWRPKALSRARQHWPWLALIAGAAWLFLLPAGVCGLLLVAIALCALAARLAKAPAAPP